MEKSVLICFAELVHGLATLVERMDGVGFPPFEGGHVFLCDPFTQ